MSKTIRITILIVVGCLLVVAASCAYMKHFFDEWANLPPPEQYPVETAQAMLEAVSTYIVKPTPDNVLPFIVYQPCWNLLLRAMQENNFQYEIRVAIFGDRGTHVPGKNTGSDEVVVHVVFKDGTRIVMQYYAGTLNLCQKKP